MLNYTTTTTTTPYVEPPVPYEMFVLFGMICLPLVCIFLYAFYEIIRQCTECIIICVEGLRYTYQKGLEKRDLEKGIHLRREDIKILNENNRNKERYGADEIPECTICLSKVKANCRSVTLDCGHRFHTKCINAWMTTQFEYTDSSSCPTCKGHILTYAYQPVVDTDTDSNSSYDEY